LGMWQKPPGARGATWTVPLAKVDAAVTAAFERYTVVGFFGDPSHTKDDETQTRLWDPLFDKWHRKYRHKLRVWARTGENNAHSVMFDMALRMQLAKFVAQVGITEADIEAKDFTHDGDPRLRKHMLAAVRMPTAEGMSIG